jgi:predicted RNA-binding protein YlqC (UPF0109 family)
MRTDTVIIVELRVAKEDRVIGKGGNTVESIRTILYAVGGRTNDRILFEIIPLG